MTSYRGIPRPFNPFLAATDPLAPMPPTIPIPRASPFPVDPLAGAPRRAPMSMGEFDDRFNAGQQPIALGTGAMPLPQQQSPASAPGVGFGERVNNFLGSDASLALAAGLLGGGSTSQAVSRGFSNAYQAQASGREERESKAVKNQTVAYFEKLGRPDLAQMASLGMGKEAFAALYAKADAPELETIYDDQTGMEYKAQWNPKTRTYERVGGMKAPSGTSLSVGPNGEVTFTQGAGAKPLTEAQSKDTVFATRARGSLPLINKFGAALTSLPQSIGGKVPVAGNYLKSPEYQQAEQAGKEFLQAILRKDTGAAITKEETAEYGSVYLPQPGDSPEVLAQKHASRDRAIRAIEAGLPPQAILALEKAGVDPSAPEGAASAGQSPAQSGAGIPSLEDIDAEIMRRQGGG